MWTLNHHENIVKYVLTPQTTALPNVVRAEFFIKKNYLLREDYVFSNGRLNPATLKSTISDNETNYEVVARMYDAEVLERGSVSPNDKRLIVEAKEHNYLGISCRRGKVRGPRVVQPDAPLSETEEEMITTTLVKIVKSFPDSLESPFREKGYYVGLVERL